MTEAAPEAAPDAARGTAPRTAPSWWRRLVLLTAAVSVVVVAWALLTEWGGVVHSHPAYPTLLALTLISSLIAAWRARRSLPRRTGWRRAVGIALLVVGIGWIPVMAWLRPMTAVEPALAAMRSGSGVTVTESATRIVLSPTGAPGATGVFFQPGALVDPRAYAAVLRPLAVDGHTVVIAKPALGIAFLATRAFDSARSDFPQVEQWVLGGHSLGGVVAAIEADEADEATDEAADEAAGGAPVVGLFFFASYPADDISESLDTAVLSISGSRDGLSTPERIDASRANLPADAEFLAIDGAVHAFFGDYGTQRGDGTPTISHDRAREQISQATVDFVDSLAGQAGQ